MRYTGKLTCALAAMLLVTRVCCGAEVTAPKISAPAGVASDGTFRIALVSDPHVSDDRRYANYITNFQNTIAQINREPVDAVLISGDLTQNFNEPSARKFKELIAVLKVKPWCVAGNHDLGNKPQPKKGSTVTEARVRQFETAIGPAFYAADLSPRVHLVAVSSALFGTGLAEEQKQWDFLASRLEKPQAGSTIVLSHYPAFVNAADEPDDYWNINLSCRDRFLKWLEQSQTAAVLSGHLHRPLDNRWKAVQFIGAPAVSFGLPAGKQQVGWRLILLHADGAITSELRYLPELPSQVINTTQELIHKAPAKAADAGNAAK